MNFEVPKAGSFRPFFWLLLIPLGILTFHGLLGAEFVGDDYDQVLLNPIIRDFNSPLKFLTGSTFNSGGAAELRGTYYKPAMTATFAVIYNLFGDSPKAFHLVQVALAILNSILLFFFLRTLFNPLVAFLAAAVFLVHPANSEAVQYVSNYQDILFMLFGLAAMNVRNTFFAAPLLLLAALSKETGLLFLPLYLAYGRLLRGEWRWAAPLPVAVAYAGLRIFVAKVGGVQAHYTPMETADTLTRLTNVPAATFYYLKNFFFPWPLSLAQHWIYREVTLTGFFLPLLAIAAALVFAFVSIRRFGRPALFFALWCLLSFGLHSQLIPLDATVADRWHYLPSIGMLGLLLLWLQGPLSHGRTVTIATAAVIAAMAAWTQVRSSHWKNEETLLSRDLRHQPDSFAIMSQLGFLLLNQNRRDEACVLLEKSVELAPAWWVNTNNYGVCLFQKGQVEEAYRMFEKSIANGRYHLAYENYAKLLIIQKRFPEAVSFLTGALVQFPNNAVLGGLLRDASSSTSSP